jgi:hypothetical protein
MGSTMLHSATGQPAIGRRLVALVWVKAPGYGFVGAGWVRSGEGAARSYRTLHQAAVLADTSRAVLPLPAA